MIMPMRHNMLLWQHFALVSAIGANANSWFYYFAAKGKVRRGM